MSVCFVTSSELGPTDTSNLETEDGAARAGGGPRVGAAGRRGPGG